MASLNRPDRLTLNAFSDPNRQGPVYNRFTNQLQTPLLGVKGIQLVNANFINSSLQLNDDKGQLLFFYYAGAAISGLCADIGNLRCIRLMPSWFVPYPGFTAYTINKYFNTGTELVAALNAAAAASGDSGTYNPIWTSGQVTFAFDTTTRRISVTSTDNTTYIAPAAADDPNVLDILRGTTNAANRIRMNTYNTSNTYATAPLQPYQEGITMNARLGFTLAYNANGSFWGSSSQRGCATSTGVPSKTLATPVVGDTPPILLGVQNVGVYLSVSTGGGMDTSNKRKNLIASIPIENAPYAINSYTTNSVEIPSLSTPNEIFEITVELIDDFGTPFNQWWNCNTQIGLALYY
jgi:hypothetical protein